MNVADALRAARSVADQPIPTDAETVRRHLASTGVHDLSVTLSGTTVELVADVPSILGIDALLIDLEGHPRPDMIVVLPRSVFSPVVTLTLRT